MAPVRSFSSREFLDYFLVTTATREDFISLFSLSRFEEWVVEATLLERDQMYVDGDYETWSLHSDVFHESPCVYDNWLSRFGVSSPISVTQNVLYLLVSFRLQFAQWLWLWFLPRQPFLPNLSSSPPFASLLRRKDDESIGLPSENTLVNSPPGLKRKVSYHFVISLRTFCQKLPFVSRQLFSIIIIIRKHCKQFISQQNRLCRWNWTNELPVTSSVQIHYHQAIGS